MEHVEELQGARIQTSPLPSLAGLNKQLGEPSSLEFQPLDQDPRALIATEVKRHQGGWISFEFQPQDAHPMALIEYVLG